MSGAIREYTENYELEIPNFDFPNWHTYYARNLKTLDAIIYMLTGITNIRGAWQNSTNYAVGDRIIDTDNAIAYECLVAHTSAATGTTFTADFVAHPTYWHTADTSPSSRGTWLTATSYYENEIVTHGNASYICRVQHISGVFATDLSAVKWEILIDFQPYIDAAAVLADADATAAAASAAAAALSAAAAAATAAALGTVWQQKGAWAANAGTFPGAGVAQNGWIYYVSVAGTVNGVVFDVGDFVIAITNNASATVYAANWLRIEGVVSSITIASQAEAQAGTNNTKVMTPLTVQYALAHYIHRAYGGI